MSSDTAINLAATSLTFSILSFLVIVVGLLFLVFPGWLETIKSAVTNFSGSPSSSGLLDHLKVLSVLSGALTPDIVLLIGFIADLMNFKIRYSVTSLIGILAVVANWGITSLISGVSFPTISLPTFSTPSVTETPKSTTPQLLGVGSSSNSLVPFGSTSDALVAGKKKKGGVQLPSSLVDNFNPCAIRGLEMFDVKGSPMGLAALAAVFAVYHLDMSIGAKRTSSQVLGFDVIAALVFANTLYSYIQFGSCLNDTSSFFSILKSTAFPVGIGLAVGGIGYTILKSKFTEFLPLNGESINTGGSKMLGGCSPGGATCSEPDDEDQIVCEAYQDGKRINSVFLQK
jgi:hypothetical protein